MPNDMLQLELSKDETTQLYILMSLFGQTGELRKMHYQENGPARTLANKIADFIGPYHGITTINKKTK